MNIVVIGCGFGGLAAAIRLQAQGHQVTIVDKRDKPGGRAYVYEQDGFTFDGGPTILTTPQHLHELFELGGKRLDDYLTLVKLDPFYNVRFEDGSVFHYTDEPKEILNQIRAFNPPDEEGYRAFFKASERVLDKGLPMMNKPFLKFTDMLKVSPDMVKLQANKSVTSFVGDYIQDERLRQVFSFHPLLIGGNPFQSTSIYVMIHKLEQAFGIWYALGGTGALVRALVQVFEDLGGTLQLNTEVQQIQVNERSKLATGVVLGDDRVMAADAVVSNADVALTYMKLIPAEFRKKWSDRKLESLTYSMSLFVLYFGTDRQYPDVAHHEILLGPRYEELMADIFDRKVLADDFALYLHRPTATDPSMAPPGCDCWYVLAPVPNLEGDIDWTQMAKPYRDRIVQYLEERYLPDLSQHIITERYIDPLHFRDTLNSYRGSAFSIEPTLMQSAWFRPQNRSEDIPNLYIVGAGTHPGAGIPGVMSSGRIVADLIGQA